MGTGPSAAPDLSFLRPGSSIRRRYGCRCPGGWAGLVGVVGVEQRLVQEPADPDR